jgi:hypothetical protein
VDICISFSFCWRKGVEEIPIHQQREAMLQ